MLLSLEKNVARYVLVKQDLPELFDGSPLLNFCHISSCEIDLRKHKILSSMQLQKQIIHTPAHFFGERDDACLLGTDEADRPLEKPHFPTDEILVERDDFHVRFADSQGRKSQVCSLIKQMYSWRGYRLDTSEVRYNPHQTTLQACNDKDTLGTVTLNIDSEDGLLADDLYRKEVDVLRKGGGTVCELTGLAVGTQLGSKELLATLFHLLHILGRRLHRATNAVIEINPRHSAYYQRLLGFRQIGESKICCRVNAPAVLLHIETDFVEEQIARYAGCRKKTERSLYPYFLSRQESEVLSQRMLDMSRPSLASRQTHC